MLHFPIMDEHSRAFMEKLHTEFHDNMLRMARSMTDSKYDAEDIVSDSYVSLMRNVSHLMCLDCNALEGYIISTIKNTAFLLHRKKKVRKEVSVEEISHVIADENTIPDRCILRECTAHELISTLKRLSQRDQIVLRMKYIEKLPNHQIAETFKVQEVSVRSMLTRARQKIYKLLGGSEYEY